jgi:hypothetical protein
MQKPEPPKPEQSEALSAPADAVVVSAVEAPIDGPVEGPSQVKKVKAPRKPRVLPKKKYKRGGFWTMPTLIFLVIGLTFAALALSGKPLRLPIWVVAEVETRLNHRLDEVLSHASGTAAVSLGGVVIIVDDDWTPRLRLEDVRLLQPDGAALVTMPEVRTSFEPSAIVRGQIRLQSLRIIGARLAVRRLENGQFDISLGQGMAPVVVDGVAGLVDAAVAVFAHPNMEFLKTIQAEAMTLSIDDRLLGRVWEMGDGRMLLENREDALALDAGVSLVSGGTEPAQADLTLIAAKETSEARLTFTVDRVAAVDLAAQAAPLAFLGVLEAPISGQISSTLDASGALASLEARLSIAAGALRPGEQTKPVAFDAASLFFTYDPARERIDLHELDVSSSTVRFNATGHAYLPGVTKGLPQEALVQLRFTQAMFDPDELFVAPVSFDEGALDFRMRLNPFTLDIGQLSLLDQGRRLIGKGAIAALPEGWSLGMDFALDTITPARLLGLWPQAIASVTRGWVAENVVQAEVSDVNVAVRIMPGQPPKLSLDYEFFGGEVRFLKSLPVIHDGDGYATIEGRTYTMVLSKGQIVSDIGGAIDATGTVFSVADIRQKPAIATVKVKAKGALTAVLWLLDRPPFSFLTKVNLPVELGQGQVQVTADLTIPLFKGVQIADVDFDVQAEVRAVSSDVLVPGRNLRSELLRVTATPEKLEISGEGQLQGVDVSALYTMRLTPEFRGTSHVEGTAELSQASMDKLAIALPKGLLQGKAQARFEVDFKRGDPPKLRLQSQLQGLGLSIPQLGWSKPNNASGALDVSVRLSKPARVDEIKVQAAGLRAAGQVFLKADGSLEKAAFSSVQIGDWLDAAVDLTARGQGQQPGVSVTSGKFDLRGLSRGQGGGESAGSAAPMSIALNRLIVTQGIELTGFQSTLVSGQGGMAGEFRGRVNGQVAVRGTLAPSETGTSIRIRGEDAGTVFSAAKIFPNAQGGSLDIRLRPTGEAGSFEGRLKIEGIRIRNAPALAELINAISVVGLLEQMNGTGLLFSETEAEFSLTPRALQITRGSAVGASLGVSATGLYVLNGGRLDMQGVISPIYLLNGIGALFTRKGEGLFGFNYRLQGNAKDPKVSINPLSILTPGMFREIFRAAPPKLEAGE